MTRTDDREALRDLIEWADDGGVDDGAITRKLDLVAALAREKLAALDAPATYDYGWRVRPGVRCVECPDCGFTFGADHTVQTDGHPAYDCPNCETAQLAPPTLPPDVREALYVALGLAWGSVRGSEEEAAITKSQEWLADQD